jgi:hypothetical protein
MRIRRVRLHDTLQVRRRKIQMHHAVVGAPTVNAECHSRRKIAAAISSMRASPAEYPASLTLRGMP